MAPSPSWPFAPGGDLIQLEFKANGHFTLRLAGLRIPFGLPTITSNRLRTWHARNRKSPWCTEGRLYQFVSLWGNIMP